MNIAYALVKNVQEEKDQAKEFLLLKLQKQSIYIDRPIRKLPYKSSYNKMKATLQEGDTLYIPTLTCLGPNYATILAEWKEITQLKKADIICLQNPNFFNSQKFREKTTTGKTLEDQFFSFLNYLVKEQQNDYKIKQKEGLAKAKAEGKRPGRHKIPITPEFIKAYTLWKQGKITTTKARTIAEMTRSTFYLKGREYEAIKNKG